MLYGMRKEICVYEDGVRRDEGGVGLEEHGGGRLRDLSDWLVGVCFLFGFGRSFRLVLLAMGLSDIVIINRWRGRYSLASRCPGLY